MSNYTITLKRISEVYDKPTVLSWFSDYNVEDYLLPSQIETIENAGLWNKEKLSQMIFEHYYLREIAFETPEMFRHYSKIRLQEIMGNYLPIIYTNSLNINPFNNETFSSSETIDRNKNENEETNDSKSSNIFNQNNSQSNSSSSSSSDSSSLDVNSDTPQGNISKTGILSGDYASSTRASEGEASSNDTTNIESTGNSENTEKTENNGTRENELQENITKNKSGYDLKMTKSDLIANYRKNIYNVNKAIIDELNSLFFALY